MGNESVGNIEGMEPGNLVTASDGNGSGVTRVQTNGWFGEWWDEYHFEGNTNYDPTLLVAVPRNENRKQYSLDNNNLPFEGYDVWHCYEFSCLTKNGLPITRLMKMRYSCIISCENEW